MPAANPQGYNHTHLPQLVAISIMVLAAFMFAGNHVSARLAFDSGTGLLLALLARGGMALMIMTAVVVWQRQKMTIPTGRVRWQLLLGLMIAGQSLCLYASVARVPVAVALLMMNTWPIFLALLTWLLGGRRPSALLVTIMVVIMLGLILVLDVREWLTNPAAMGSDWVPGVLLGLTAAIFFAIAIWVTNHRLTGMPGAVRSVYTMLVVLTLLVLAGVFNVIPDGMALPMNPQGWLGLVLLALLYGAASTILFVLVPRLNMARNAPVMNSEPVAALLLAYLVLGQTLSTVQLVGGTIVLAGIVWLSLTRA